MKFIHTLLAKYLLIIVVGLILLPFSFPLISIITYLPIESMNGTKEMKEFSTKDIENRWKETAQHLQGQSTSEIKKQLSLIQSDYPNAEVFWVNENEKLVFDSNEDNTLPPIWSTGYTVQFMKERIGGDPFTVISFIGDDYQNGFIALEIPREELEPPVQRLISRYEYVFIVGILLILGSFMMVSLLFFTRIRKRLVHLQNAMMIRDDHRIPYPVEVKKRDEISQLEISFNLMVDELKEGRRREVEEEQLRRNLIANLSHDLRTPLTAIRAHAYSLKDEALTTSGQASIRVIDHKVEYVDRLIDNLMSYTLLTAGKYRYSPEVVDIHYVIKLLIASWYPVFEQENFEIEVCLQEEKVYWNVDPQWMERVFENVFQNVLRHAKVGAFLSVSSTLKNNELEIDISDKGPGMKKFSEHKGVGIGLAIVSLMTKEMGIDWEVTSTNSGTTMVFKKEINQTSNELVDSTIII